MLEAELLGTIDERTYKAIRACIPVSYARSLRKRVDQVRDTLESFVGAYVGASRERQAFRGLDRLTADVLRLS